MGGEKSRSRMCCTAMAGSPPHGRGKEGSENIARTLAGITPAWAGKRSTLTRCYPAIQDHPRAGREKQTDTVYAVLPYGSSPRMRGKAVRTGIFCLCFRITPAWAGKSRPVSPPHRPHRDHPRVGGEKGLRVQYAAGLPGSPPHGRGKDVLPCGKVNSSRITPARAGKRSGKSASDNVPRDHPRVGGEKVTSTLSRIPK